MARPAPTDQSAALLRAHAASRFLLLFARDPEERIMTAHTQSRRTPARTVLRVALYAACAFFAGWLLRPHVEALLHRGPVPVGTPTERPSGEGWIDLLDAAHAPNWKNVGDDLAIFEVRDGVLHIFGRTIYPLRYATYTGETFSDFDLHAEFKVTPGANSGIFLRAQPNDPVNRGFEVQVLDDFGDPPSKNSCGAIYDVVTPMYNLSRRTGEWNSYDISVSGTRVTVFMNGWKVSDTDFAQMTTPLGKFAVPYAQMAKEGSLALQDHGGEVWYRNVMIRARVQPE